MTSQVADRQRAVAAARSLLFVPGDRPERFPKAAGSGADLVVCDLEDAVAAEAKPVARQEVVRWLADGGSGCVRVNAIGSPEHDADVAALEGTAGLVAVMVPKAEQPGALTSVATRLAVPVIALVESAAGMVAVNRVAGAEGVARLAFGHLDYCADLGCSPGRDALLSARSAIVLASRAAGVAPPVDGVTPQLDDEERLAGDVTHARELGFTGKLLIHPRQVPGTHAAYRPSDAEVSWARRVLEAAAQGGVHRVDGEMVDAPVVARAQDVLRRAEEEPR